MDTLPIINRAYDLYKQVVEMNHLLEKRWRYSLGMSLESTIVACIEQLILAKNAPKSLKGAYLLKASSYQEIAALKLRLILELNLANKTKVFQAQGRLVEIGKMLGGWLRSLDTR